MEVKGAALLYTLATLAVTFAGFAALLVILRQSAGSALSVLDRFLTRTVVSHLSIVAAGALVPSILALYDLQSFWSGRLRPFCSDCHCWRCCSRTGVVAALRPERHRPRSSWRSLSGWVRSVSSR